MRIVKFINQTGKKQFGIIEDDRVFPLKFDSLSSMANVRSIKKFISSKSISIKKQVLLPPTDERVHLYCAGLNYIDHAKEVKMPVPKSPVFFTKPYTSICGAYDNIIFPQSISLLDYEIELAAVIARPISARDKVTHENLPEYIFGITIMNDVSARDLQLTAGQWFLGKSFRTFAPLGPVLQTLDIEAMLRLYDLDLKLRVNSERGISADKLQNGNTSGIIFRLHTLVNTLSEKFDLLPGDIISTGTPKGVAMSHTSKLRERMEEIFGIAKGKRTSSFIEREKKYNKHYLTSGETVIASISSKDGIVDLGEQRNSVVRI
jgi:2-keto-4-pentenoate hydratase/2-oxohepta-3-ene-1,7-dioic acid hydratase in catechol pathway